MSSPIYQQYQPQNNFVSMINQFRQNPIAMLSSRYNIPQGDEGHPARLEG